MPCFIFIFTHLKKKVQWENRNLFVLIFVYLLHYYQCLIIGNKGDLHKGKYYVLFHISQSHPVGRIESLPGQFWPQSLIFDAPAVKDDYVAWWWHMQQVNDSLRRNMSETCLFFFVDLNWCSNKYNSKEIRSVKCIGPKSFKCHSTW